MAENKVTNDKENPDLKKTDEVKHKNNSEKKCFIITPIGEPNSNIRREIDGIYNAVIVPALSSIGYLECNIQASHQIYTSGRIDKQMIDRIINDDLVIVNLTENNANVMYELAVRHAIGKPLLIIARNDTKLSFDVKNERVFYYTNDPQGAIDLREELSKALLSIDSFKADNMIIDSLISSQEKMIFEKKEAITVSGDVLTILMDRLSNIENSISQWGNNILPLNKGMSPNKDNLSSNITKIIRTGTIYIDFTNGLLPDSTHLEAIRRKLYKYTHIEEECYANEDTLQFSEGLLQFRFAIKILPYLSPKNMVDDLVEKLVFLLSIHGYKDYNIRTVMDP